MAERSEVHHAAMVARNRKLHHDALGVLGVPERLRSFCDCDYRAESGPRPLSVTVTTSADVETADLDLLATLGFSLNLKPKGRLDLRDLVEGLGRFAIIQGWVGTRGSEASVVGLDALEHALSVTGIYLDGDMPVSVDLSGLPLLTHAGGIPIVNAAAKNPRIRVISQGFSALPRDFSCAYPLEELTAKVSGSFRDLTCLSDRSALRRLDIRGAATFDFTDLTDCRALEVVELFACREVLGFGTLVGLPNVKTVILETPRSIPGLDGFDKLPFSLRIPTNYVVSWEQQERLTSKADLGVPAYLRSYFGPLKPARPPRISAATRLTLVDGQDSTTFAPWEVSTAEDGAGFTIQFEDWDSLSERVVGQEGDPRELNGKVGEQLARRVLAEDAPGLLTEGRIEFDAEAGFMMIHVKGLDDVEHTVRVLAIAWADKRRMRSLIEEVL